MRDTGSSALLFVPGFWHGSWCWNPVMAELGTRRCQAVDLLGQGLRSQPLPASLLRPFDQEAYATTRSPVADVTLERAAMTLVDDVRRFGGGERVTVVAHSAGGAVLTAAAELAPQLFHRLVYVAALIPHSGSSAAAYLAGAEQEGERMNVNLVGDPFVIGASRIDTVSEQARESLRAGLYSDVDGRVAEAALSLLDTDAPVGIVAEAAHPTAARWGSIPRVYVRCDADVTIRPRLQDRFIAEVDRRFPANPTQVSTLHSGHSPFLSQPERLARLLDSLD